MATINYNDICFDMFTTKTGVGFLVESYLGKINGVHRYSVKFLNTGKTKEVSRSQILNQQVTEKIRKTKIIEVLQVDQPTKNKSKKSIGGEGLVLMSLDAGTHSTGYAIFNGRNLIKSGEIIANDKDRFTRIFKMVREIEFLCREYKVSHLEIEDIYLSNNGVTNDKVHTYRCLANLQGVIAYMCQENSIKLGKPIYASEWKSHFNILKKRETGKVLAIKEVEMRTGKICPEDEAEAILIGLYVLENKVNFNV